MHQREKEGKSVEVKQYTCVQAEWFKASFSGDLWQKNSRKSKSEGLHDGSEICSHVEKYKGIDQMDSSG